VRVVLTGATGFLGRHLLDRLRDHHVLCPARDPSRVPARHGVRAIAADLGRDGEWTREIAAFAPHWCFHLAWEGLPDYSPARCEANLAAALRLVDAVSAAGIERLIVAGTCWEYGAKSGPVAETEQPRDVGVFAATKLALLDAVRTAAASRFEYRWGRLFFVYGPGQRATSLIPSARAAFLAGSTPELREPDAVQDFIHVEDAADGLAALAALNSTSGGSGVFNIGTGSPASVGAVANLVADHYGRPRPFPQAASTGRGFWADTEKTAGAGWHARIAIENGIERTLAAMDAAS
jgi:nucleoside-diphosphate-sugar epimerase